MKIDIISLFPEYFNSPFEQSLLKRAIQRKLVTVNCVDLRRFGVGVHSQVDDCTYGGGVGMVLKPEPIFNAISYVKQSKSHCIYLSPQGKLLTASKSRELASFSHLIFLCGHYEGVDERVIEECIDEEISIGDYVLTSGLPAALVVIDALMRFIPGVIENSLASEQDSFENDLLDFSHYTRPRFFQGKEVPHQLLEGNHKEIIKWRQTSKLNNTIIKRPDLYFRYLVKNDSRVFFEEKEIQNQDIQDINVNIKYFLTVNDIEKSLSFYSFVFFDFFKIIVKEELLAKVSLFNGKLNLLLRASNGEEVVKTDLFSVSLENSNIFFKICQKWKKKGKVFLHKLNKNSWIFSSKDPSKNGWIFILNTKDGNS